MGQIGVGLAGVTEVVEEEAEEDDKVVLAGNGRGNRRQ